MRPLCSQAAMVIARQCASLRCAWAASRRTTLRSVSTGTSPVTPSSVAFCITRSMRSPRETPWASVSEQRRLALQRALGADRDRHAAAGEGLDARGELAAGTVEERQLLAHAQPQHPQHVVGGGAGELHARAGGKRRLHEHAAQAHASSMPSRATSTMRSISCGVTT